ncbi:hypothetical protein DFH07DRAFT_761337 [Mycena maculata]|uniref:BTB domain-containing protein n=1 Tax=Mycena maculata TaxID=230809 RepID=A0AAD7MJ10_9AGAR|nr:hypothetical protein DFH07DRAFT_761337 [Mycena maculata]
MDVTNPEPDELAHRVVQLWFEDGNLVIQASNTQFRVYCGILTVCLPVFQDMFSFPQPPAAGSELVEGCPIVHLPDPEWEVTPFLRAIFEPESVFLNLYFFISSNFSRFFRPYPAPTEFDTIAGCLRLSHKYGVEYLRHRALVHLSSAYPTTLSAADEGPVMGAARLDHVQDVIQLAREVEAPWILPIAFYRLSASFSQLTKEVLHGTIYTQEAFLSGHNSHIQHAATEILRFLFNPLDVADCRSPTECTKARVAAVSEMWKDISQAPSILWKVNDWAILDGVCPACLSILKETRQTACQAFWDKLPGAYGLPSWDELEKMKIAAIGEDWYAYSIS